MTSRIAVLRSNLLTSNILPSLCLSAKSNTENKQLYFITELQKAKYHLIQLQATIYLIWHFNYTQSQQQKKKKQKTKQKPNNPPARTN